MTNLIHIVVVTSAYRKGFAISREVETAMLNRTCRSAAQRSNWANGGGDLVDAHAGRLALDGNRPLVLRSFEKIRCHVPAAGLLPLGDGPSHRQLVPQQSSYIPAGMRHDGGLAAHDASTDLFLFPIVIETYRHITLEALASGLPILAHRKSGASKSIDYVDSDLVADQGADDQPIRPALDPATRSVAQPRIADVANQIAAAVSAKICIFALH